MLIILVVASSLVREVVLSVILLIVLSLSQCSSGVLALAASDCGWSLSLHLVVDSSLSGSLLLLLHLLPNSISSMKDGRQEEAIFEKMVFT